MLDAKLVVVGGDAKSAEVRLKLPTIIGRGNEAGLTVPHGLVSRQHTEIIERDGRLFVRDLGSLNGTFVNNHRIEDEQPLDPNQLLTLGNITFRAIYEIGYSPQAGDAVAFEEVRVSPNASPPFSPVAKSSPGSISEVVSFDDTVPLDSIQKNSQEATPAVSEELISDESSKVEVDAKRIDSEPEIADSSNRQENVFEPSESVESNSNSGTDKSFKTESAESADASSNLDLQFEAKDVDPASKSVSVSALEDLPTGQAAVSFLGALDVGDDVSGPSNRISSVEIDLGGDGKSSDLEVDSSLGSFLNKLPR